MTTIIVTEVSAFVNVQIIPAPPENVQLPSGARIEYTPAKEWQAVEEIKCPACGGSGMRRMRICRFCESVGTGRFIQALRLDVQPEQYQEVAAFLAELAHSGASYNIQKNLRLPELGGGYTKTGKAQIVCGLSGERLRSVKGAPRMDEEHALFYTKKALVVLFSHHRKVGEGEVWFLALDKDAPEQIGIVSRKLYQFTQEDGSVMAVDPDAPKIAGPPMEAIKAAIDKSMDYHCRSAYFADGRYAQGLSGARR